MKVKEVRVKDRRYVVCLNEEQRRKDAADRETIVSALTKQLKKGPKSLVGNKGYRKYLKIEKNSTSIDKDRIKYDNYVRKQGKEVPVGVWVAKRNEESTVLFISELACLLGIGLLGLALARRKQAA